MRQPPGYKALLREYNALPSPVRNCFVFLPSLLPDYPYQVSLSYLFTNVEIAKHMTIYCGIVKLHKADAKLTRKAVDSTHMSRAQFRILFATVFGKPIKPTALSKLEAAEAIRDKVMHGKQVSDPEMRAAIATVLEFAVEFNDFVESIAGFKPFGELRGFKGRANCVEASTTRWLLKGIGLSIS